MIDHMIDYITACRDGIMRSYGISRISTASLSVAFVLVSDLCKSHPYTSLSKSLSLSLSELSPFLYHCVRLSLSFLPLFLSLSVCLYLSFHSTLVCHSPSAFSLGVSTVITTSYGIDCTHTHTHNCRAHIFKVQTSDGFGDINSQF